MRPGTQKTSTFLAHMGTRQACLPRRESDYTSAVSSLLAPVHSLTPRGIEISPFTLTKGTSGYRAPGQLFNSQQYWKLMVVMVIQTNSIFKLEERNTLGTRLVYCNGNGTAIW